MMQNLEKGEKRNIFFAAGFLLVVTFFLFDIIFGNMGLIEYFSIKEKSLILQAKKERMEGEIQKLEEEAHALSKDLHYIEDIARKDLGMVKEREKIIILDKSDGKVVSDEEGESRERTLNK